MIEVLREFVEDAAGVTTVEYAVAGSLISIALVGAFTLLSGGMEASISDIASALRGAP